MTLRLALSLVLGSLAIACSGGGGGEPQGNGGTSGTSEPTTPSAPPAQSYTVSCGGDVAKTQSLAVATDSTEPRASGSSADAGPCAAQDVVFSYAPPAHRCIGTDIFAWDGAGCVAHPTGAEGGSLNCKGSDCEHIFKTKDACETAYKACVAK